MANIGKIISWKFSDQEGMATLDNKIIAFPSGVSGVDYVDGLPSDANITTWTNEYNAYVTATAYKDDRKSSYPTIGDQLDMLWHAIDTGNWTAAKVKTTDFYTELKAVKDANPKPEGD
jgi:hypothetical protein